MTASSHAIALWLGVSDRSDEDRELCERRPDPRDLPALRACLGPLCLGRRTFPSEHAGHRICPACRDHLRSLYGVTFSQPDDAP